MNRLVDRLRSRLDQRRDLNIHRSLPPEMERSLVDFSSNDYLSLAGQGRPGTHGSTGSRLLTGNSSLMTEFEEFLAAYHKAPAALFFGSGYLANLGLLSCMNKIADRLVLDQFCHASLRDGAVLSGLPLEFFEHNHLGHLEQILKQDRGQTLVVVEAVYSMDGDECPLKEVLDLCMKYHAGLIVDEAHSVGIYGAKGEGLCVELGLQDFLWARVLTFGKALGRHGAAILGTLDLKEYLVNFSRPFIYTTAPPLSQVQELKKAYDNMSYDNSKTLLIRDLTRLFDESLNDLFSELTISGKGSGSALRGLILGPAQRAKSVAVQLSNSGMDVRPIVPPTVPRNASRIRISFHAHNTRQQVEELCQRIKDLLTKEDPRHHE